MAQGIHDAHADRTLAEELLVSDLFVGLSAELLAECAARGQTVRFPRGTNLARQGDVADSFYVILEGSVEIVVEHKGEREEFVDVLRRGDCVGDLAVLLGQPRTATVRALRDCRALRISTEDFAWLTRTSPDFTLELARVLGRRLQRTTHRAAKVRPVDRIVTVVLSETIPIDVLRSELETSISRARATSVVQVVDASAQDDAAIAAASQDADAILIVADPASLAQIRRFGRIVHLVEDLRPRPHVHLVLWHNKEPPHSGTLAWLRDHRPDAWHHVAVGNAGSFDRMARRVVGRAVGVVLSGGGARGFAHIGVLKAFAETGTPVDAIAGSSMGAIIGALHAFGLSVPDIIAVIRRNFIERSGMPDYAIPYVALRTGASTDAYLKAAFGKARIEDLPIPFFSVSSNLSTAETVVHETGRLWRAVRASASVPGLLPPIRLRGGFLVDGGLLDNLPVRAMRDRLSGRIVASDVSVAVDPMRRSKSSRRRFRPFARARMPSLGSIMMRTVQLASVRDSRVSGVPADLYLNPPVSDIGMSDFDRLDEIVERGTEYARRQLAGWKG